MPRAEAPAAEPPAAVASGMRLELSAAEKAARDEFRAFAAEHIAPFAAEWERQERVPEKLLDALRSRGYLGAILPAEAGGCGMDPILYGLLTEEIGRACSSVRSLLTVHDMVTLALWRCGSPRIKEQVVPAMARGEMIGALGLSEPDVGSAAATVETRARRGGGGPGDGWVLDGTKKWTTFGMRADRVLVFAQAGAEEDDSESKHTAFLVEATAEGLARKPLPGIMGTAASMIAEISLAGCRVADDHRVGGVGKGMHVVTTALDLGRYSVAWGAVGIAQASLDASLDYAAARQQGGHAIGQYQLIQRLLTDMIVQTRAARLLCYRAGYLRRTGDPGSLFETMIAKYHASRTAVAAASDAVQIHGANGLSPDYPVARYLRDAKVTEIIEGSTQIQQAAIAGFPLEEL